MLSVAPVSIHQGCHYYSQDSYYTKEQTLENSEWQGLGTEFLGLGNGIDPREFQSLLRGISPHSGEALNVQRKLAQGQHRAGIDLTFSAPKSVSIAALVGGDERLEVAHREAVAAALRVAEERYSITRVGGNKDRREEVTGNLTAAKFHHNTSRARDPQLHTHCVVINAVRREDGEWRSLSNTQLYSNSKLMGLVYQNELATRALALGYSIERNSKGTFELSGYSAEQLKAFSKRREQIEDLGARNQKEARTLVNKNRPTKGAEVPIHELKQRWQAEAKAIKIEHPLAQNARNRTQEMGVDHVELVKHGVAHATQKDVVFRREKFETFALTSKLGRVTWNQLSKEFSDAQTRGEVLKTHRRDQFTTEEAIAAERTIVEGLKQGRQRYAPLHQSMPETLTQNKWGLNEEQIKAVSHLLTSRDQFLAWQGVAGAGKTYAINAFREIASAQGLRIEGFAPSAQAAHVLQQEAKIPTTTVAGLTTAYDLGARASPGSFQIVDEAGLLSAKQCAQIMAAAQRDGARVLFVGDVRQLSGVEAGNPFKLMQQKGIEMSLLDRSQRQKNLELKESVELIRAEKERQALNGIKANIHEIKDELHRAKFIGEEYLKLTPEQRDQTLVLAGTNRERALLTEQIRNGLKQNGELAKEVTVTALKARDLSRQELSIATNVNVGDVMVFHKNAKSLEVKKGQVYEVQEVKADLGIVRARNSAGQQISFSTAKFQEKYKLYEKEDLQICEGEKVRITRNDKELGIRNGEEFLVRKNQHGLLELTGKHGKTLSFGADTPFHLAHNYVNTVFSSQGKTCDKAIISVDHTFGREAMYVALSRAKFEVCIVTENTEQMTRTIGQSRAKVSALEVVREAEISQPIQHAHSHARGRRM